MEGVDNYFSFLEIPGRPPKPRTAGITIVTDKSLSRRDARSLMETQGEIIDYIKVADHPALIARHSGAWLKEKIDIYHEHQVKVLVGGVAFEVAAAQNRVDLFMEKVKEVGFDAVEVSDDVIPSLEPDVRVSCIQKGTAVGLDVFSETGKKGPVTPLVVDEVVPILRRDLAAGARLVTVENVDLVLLMQRRNTGSIRRLVEDVGLQHILVEIGPAGGFPDLAAWAIETFGPEVNLENIEPHQVRTVDGMRRGMDRTGNFQFLSERGGRL